MAALYEELKKKKSELGITTEQLSRLSGVPVGTINKILNGETKSPRYDTLNALNHVLSIPDSNYSTADRIEKLFLRMQLLLKSRVTTHWMITMHFLMMSVQSLI